MQTNKKALSPIVATILLVVVAVILVTITLSWGKGFTNKGLEGSNTILKETTNNYMIGSPKLNAQGVLSFKNISPGDKSITITGYKIISSSDDGNFNTILDIEDTTISPGGTHIISIPAFPPEQKVTIQLITDENEYISIDSITNIPEEQQDITVPEVIPELTADITSPANGASYSTGVFIGFVGVATNNQGAYTCSWNSNISGSLGTGCSKSVKIFSTGTHTITLTITDEALNSATDNITLIITLGGCQDC